MRSWIVSVCWAVSLAVAVMAGIRIGGGLSASNGASEQANAAPTNAAPAAPAVVPSPTAREEEARPVAKPEQDDAVVALTAPATKAAPAAVTLLDAKGVLTTKDPAQRAFLFAKLVQGLTPANARGLLEAYVQAGFDSPRSQEEFRMLSAAWASLDGPGALEFLKSLSHESRPENTMREALTAWSIRDLNGAEQWARSQTTNAENRYLIGVIAGATQVDMNRATALLYSLPYGRTRGDALEPVIDAYLAQSSSATMNWVSTIPDERLKQGAVPRVAMQMAAEDPKAAADFVLNASDSNTVARNVSLVARHWGFSEANEAVAWAQSLPAGPVQDAALASSLPALAAKDPAAAERMLNTAPASRATDPARMQLAREYAHEDPPRALAWANTLTDPRMRDMTVRRITEEWQRRDPEAAQQFFTK
jgi:hypothetical protein